MIQCPTKKESSRNNGKVKRIVLIGAGFLVGFMISFALYSLGLLSVQGIAFVGVAGDILTWLKERLKPDKNSKWKSFVISIFATMTVSVLFFGALAVSQNSSDSIEPVESVATTQTPEPMPEESEGPDNTPGPFEMTEKQSFASVGTIENDSNANSKYVPKLSTENEAYLFLDDQTFLHHGEDISLTDGELYELIHERFFAAYHSVENFSAEKVNGNPELSSLILGATEIDIQIKQAIATNRLSDLAEYYDELLQIYQTATSKAPRGEFFLQLGRPYYEKALYMKRENSKEKDEVFRLCAQAVLAYRTASTYDGTLAETDADLLYRIAAIYHYLGDTPSLQSEYRVRIYRLAIAYLTFASDCATDEDDYYGYIEYYRGMVMHKLAIVTTDSLDANHYLVLAREAYLLALDQRQYNDSLLADLDHAVKDIDYRLS